MALCITADCIACGACDYICPNDAIVPSTRLYKIVPECCTECAGQFDSPQCVPTCPVDCIVPAESGLGGASTTEDIGND